MIRICACLPHPIPVPVPMHCIREILAAPYHALPTPAFATVGEVSGLNAVLRRLRLSHPHPWSLWFCSRLITHNLLWISG